MQNYHRHSCYSNIFTADSTATNEEYAQRAAELGHKILSSVEHGWQGNYFQTYELAKKYGLKFVFGTEAYWVKDRIKEYPVISDDQVKKKKDGTESKTKDRTNSHIVVLARNESGRQEINEMLSVANEDGYYFKPRVDLELLLNLSPDNVFVTSACVAFWTYEDIEDIVVKLHEHFKDNFMLEIQYHNTDKQKSINRRIKELSQKYGIKMIVGMDSHYILESDSWKRDFILDAKGIHYDDESNCYMDYPSDEETMKRFLEQGIFTKSEVQEAMDNTDVCLTFEDYDNVRVFNDDIKLPSLYPNKTKEEKNKLYSRLITKKFKEYMKDVPKELYDEYFEGVKQEVQTYKDTGMVDYPLLDYEIVKEAVRLGGLITDTGRGSAVGYFTNTLCGFSKVDRFESPIKLYPERFISKTRILETKSLPDIDLNVGTPDIFEQAQINVLGEDHVAPMIAFGTFKKKSSFKIYAKAQGLDFTIANNITDQIGKYEEALKYADEDEEIDIYDYVDECYRQYIEDSEKYFGIISDKKKAPSAYLLYDGNIRREIGLIKCKSDSTKKEYITCVMDGAVAERNKFLKNDILKVDVVLLIEKVFNRIGIEHFGVKKLSELVKDDQKVWDLYANGYTIGLNQTERKKKSNATVRKVMAYKPQNVSELAAFIAAIRPGFKSMYSKFESREPFEYGIPAFDKIIQTEQFPYSYIIYQEQTMNALHYGGFPLDECYGMIKAIAKKHPEKVRPMKSKFIEGFKKRVIEDEGVGEDNALEMSERVWQIISDNCGYGFNSSHALCMCYDSLYGAWQKANYPYEFYEVLLQHYSDKGNKDKVSWIKEEMEQAFGIVEGEYKFGLDNRRFSADKEHHCINPSLLGIKGMSQKCADELYELSKDKEYTDFSDLYTDIKSKTSVNRAKMEILIKLGYFSKFGNVKKLLDFVEIYDLLYGKSQFSKATITKNPYMKYIVRHTEETEKQYRKFDYKSALSEIWEDLPNKDITIKEKLANELELYGYLKTTVPIGTEYMYVRDYECKYKNPKLTLYSIENGTTDVVKVKRAKYDELPIHEGDIIKVLDANYEGTWKLIDDKWVQNNTVKEKILKKWSLVK